MLMPLSVVLLCTIPFTSYVDLRVTNAACVTCGINANSGSIEWWAVDGLNPGVSQNVKIDPVTKDSKQVRVSWIGSTDYPFPIDVDVYVRLVEPYQHWPAEAVGRIRFAPSGWVSPAVVVVPAKGGAR